MRGRMALLLGLAMLPAGAIAMQVGLNALEARQAAFEQELGRRAIEAVDAERRFFEEIRQMLRVMAASPNIVRLNGDECNAWLADVRAQYADIAALASTTAAGRVLCAAPPVPPGMTVSSTVRDRALERNAFTIGYQPHGHITPEPILVAFSPTSNEAGTRFGLIGASIRLSTLNQQLNSNPALAGARAATTADAAVPPLPTVEQTRDSMGDRPTFVDVKGGAAVIVPLLAPDIYFVMSWAPDQPAWRSWTALAISVAAPVLIWLFAIGAGWFAIEVYVTRPLSSLEGSARAYARGDDLPETAALSAAPDEIRALRRTLGAMAKTLRGREQRLVEALAEERALLREVHHRVKNNLQMVASLLNIQARGARDESEARGLSRAHDRVQLLALAHQKIYASGAVRDLRLDELAADIARSLLQSRGLQAQNVTFQFATVRTDADRAVPLAFLIGEAVSAALDETAEDRRLVLHLDQDEEGEVRFAVETEAESATSPQNIRLIDAFARQLGATLGRDPARPSRLWVRVPPAP
jgi:two-component system, sensor histidine kinase PdtaS